MDFNGYISWCFALIFLSLPITAAAQTGEENLLIEQMVELNAEAFGENFDFMELSEQLEFFRKYPIDLNKTDGDELRKLQFLSPLLIQNLLEHREQAGNFISVYELQAVSGFDIQLAQLLSPFVTVHASGSLKGVSVGSLLGSGEHDLMFRFGRTLQEQLGYTIRDTGRSRYLGSPDRLFLRYRYQFGRDFQVAVNMKKDAGEQFFAGAQRYGFDFYSVSVHVRNQGRIRALVLGDYALQFGQGLAMWNGLQFGKSVMPHHVAKQAAGLSPYTSSNEVLFLRGASATIGFGRVSVTPFVSLRRLDGSVQTAADSALVVGSLGQTGLHRTPNEVANRQALQQWVYGMNAQYRIRRLNVGATLFHTQFDGMISPQDVLRNQYAFRGNALTNANLYYHYGVRGFYLFGEAAHSLGSGFAFVNGAIGSLSHRLSLVLLHRDYQRDYHSFFNQGMAEGSYAVNERGFFSGLIYHPSRKVEWMVYADFFRFPWLRYRVDAPSRGVDILSQFTYTRYKQARFFIRYRYRNRQENLRMENLPENAVVDVFRHQLRVEGQYRVNDNWSMRDRIELMRYEKETETEELGWLAYHDVLYNPMGSKFSGNCRIAVFATPGYDSRIYAYENDVLYGYSFPVYYNRGIRFYTNIRYRLMRRTDLWLRYAAFIYRDMDEIGSGLDRIAGNMRSDIRVQMRLRF